MIGSATCNIFEKNNGLALLGQKQSSLVILIYE